MPFCHIDAYRLEHLEEDEVAQIGLEECFLPDKVAYVEWPQFISAFLPPDTIYIDFQPSLAEERCLQFSYNPQTQLWLEEVLLNLQLNL
jgi:tRNA A37 threonylcarbamoyladenosine biosynthesis protein TsaE